MRVTTILFPAVPLNNLLRIIPSCSGSSSEFLRSLLPPSPFRAWALLPGSLPSSRHHRVRPLISRTSQVLDTFRPQVFTTSRRLSPHPALGLVSSRSHVQDLPLVQGLPISAQRSCPRRNDLPPCRCDHLPLARTNPDGHGRHPRLRGLDPRRSSRTTRLVVSLPRGRTPLRVSSPPGPGHPPWSRLIRDLRSWSSCGQTIARTCVRARACPQPPSASHHRETWLVRHRTSRPARDFEPTNTLAYSWKLSRETFFRVSSRP